MATVAEKKLSISILKHVYSTFSDHNFLQCLLHFLHLFSKAFCILACSTRPAYFFLSTLHHYHHHHIISVMLMYNLVE
ncbi:hypothetical protein GYH30_018113 [Glycine max]|uniref:Uncharacterized protein n=1 Tax=Glycine max TaxID=3847 RepID=A0A0R0J272_SOYBN|nr:hypothetical protein GYH30_018113 [Glycine max]